MKIEEIYPNALVFEKTPHDTNFLMGQVVVVPSENKAYILDSREPNSKNWLEIKDAQNPLDVFLDDD